MGILKTHVLKYPVRALTVFLFLLLLMILLNSGTLFGQGFNTATYYTKVTVQEGDTLWEIANNLDGASNIDNVIAGIIKYNKLPNHNIAPGQILYVPSVKM
ncbi:Peptidoglycan-binding lysin domain protein [Syntrophobotulus glycolicus DSM 8271]|uniref:Peptidoglycan-binding lysin domain protein n=1 Tax=Syntrophobotulus glycolicus (strain DSM 8271 / FlGlyR) TaxID=645991 RepID=F0SZG9_SYNGF|nr:LysM peptidoglycan-binding domain-containing protein [Syntrophobotulus glycolicus]ADY56055.1 Peptidoglycan-binding lysin domain protein [Syntrophobotulus glycolicus DSM 8271]